MAYTSPTTRSTGYVVGATQWNELVMNDRWKNQTDTDGAPFCFAYRSTGMTLTTNVPTLITWNAEVADNAAVHSTSTNTGRMVAPIDGWYDMDVQIVWQSYSVGTRNAYIAYNGTGVQVAMTQVTATTSFQTAYSVNHTAKMLAGEYVECWGYHEAAIGLDLLGSATGPRCQFKFRWIAKI